MTQRQTELYRHTESFSLTLAVDGASPATQDLYARTFQHLHAARITLKTFERADLLNRVKAVAPASWEKSTLIAHLSRVVTFANWLRAQGAITRKHAPPRQTKRPKLRDLPTDEEIDRLLCDLAARSHHSPQGRRRTRTQDEIITRLLIETGARISEILALGSTHVITDTASCRILIEGTKTAAAERAVQITPALYTLAHHYTIQWPPPALLLFRSRTDQPMHPNEFAKWLKAYCSGLGIEALVTPHVLRHRYIWEQIAAGASAFEVMTRVGHSSIEMTGYYFNQVRRLMPPTRRAQTQEPQRAQLDIWEDQHG